MPLSNNDFKTLLVEMPFLKSREEGRDFKVLATMQKSSAHESSMQFLTVVIES